MNIKITAFTVSEKSINTCMHILAKSWMLDNEISTMYYTAIQSLYHHLVCNATVSCKANGDRNQLGAWLDSVLKAA